MPTEKLDWHQAHEVDLESVLGLSKPGLKPIYLDLRFGSPPLRFWVKRMDKLYILNWRAEGYVKLECSCHAIGVESLHNAIAVCLTQWRQVMIYDIEGISDLSILIGKKGALLKI